MHYLKTLPGRFAWLIVLSVTLGISAYSLYFVARHLGVPKLFAIGMSTAYDGTALLAADYSLRYAQAGASGTAPNLAVLGFAAVSAWLNSLHAVLGNELPAAIPMWAFLPVAAVVIFEIHTSFERRKALARAGIAYPAPIPKFGGWTWFLFPLNTLDQLRAIVRARSIALAGANLSWSSKPPKPVAGPEPNLANPAVNHSPRPAANLRTIDANVVSINRPSPRVVREWAWANDVRKPNGEVLSDRARIPGDIWAAYRDANGGG